jgi:PKD repeat protein
VANINTPANNTEWEAGKPVLFSATLSFDPDQNLTNYSMYYRWDFPSQTLEGVDLKVINYTNFTTPGNYAIRLTVIDEELLEGYDNVTVRIIPENLVPVAVVAIPSNGSRFFTTEFVNFSGAGSYDPEGGALAYTWILDGASQLGTGINLSVRLPAGTHQVTLRLQDDRGAEGTAVIAVAVEVNTPPLLESPAVDPPNGTLDQDYTFSVTYTDANGERAESVLLVLDGVTHAMDPEGNQSPQDGVLYTLAVRPSAGSHSFYMIASDGNLTNVSTNVSGPTLWEPVVVLSDDGLGLFSSLILPPYDMAFSVEGAEIPPAPSALVPASPAYSVSGSAADGTDLHLSLSFAFSTAIKRSTAALYAVSSDGSGWDGIVSVADAVRGTVTAIIPRSTLPATLRIFAQPVEAPADAPPALAISYRGTTEPNETVTFNASGSWDPEGASLLHSWRFAGPGLDTAWVTGREVELAFPRAGTYVVFLKGEDGAGNTVYQNMTVEIVEFVPPVITPPDEGVVIASLAVAVAVSAVLAVLWRSSRPKPIRTYDDLYGRAYKERMWDEREYAELFKKFADGPPGTDGPEAATTPGDGEPPAAGEGQPED